MVGTLQASPSRIPPTNTLGASQFALHGTAHTQQRQYTREWGNYVGESVHAEGEAKRHEDQDQDDESSIDTVAVLPRTLLHAVCNEEDDDAAYYDIDDDDDNLSIENPTLPSPCHGTPTLHAADSQAAIHAFTATTDTLHKIWAETGAEVTHTNDAMSTMWAGISAVFRQSVERETFIAEGLRKDVHALQQQQLQLHKTVSNESIDVLSKPLRKKPLYAQKKALQANVAHLKNTVRERRALFCVLAALNEDLGGKEGILPIPKDLAALVDLTEDKVAECIDVINGVGDDREKMLNGMIHGALEEVTVLWDQLCMREAERTELLKFIEIKREGATATDGKKTVTVATLSSWVGRAAPTRSGELATDLCGGQNLQEIYEIVCHKRDKLQAEFNARLALQISEMTDFLHSLHAQYHTLTADPSYSTSQPYPNEISQALLNRIEADVSLMEKKIDGASSVLSLLKRREEILEAKGEMEVASQDKDRLRDRSRNMAQILLHEEKTRKAVRKELPHIEKKLLAFCRSFREENNAHFTYAGRPLESVLSGEEVPAGQQGGRRSTAAGAPGAATGRSGTRSPTPTRRGITPVRNRPPMR